MNTKRNGIGLWILLSCPYDTAVTRDLQLLYIIQIKNVLVIFSSLEQITQYTSFKRGKVYFDLWFDSIVTQLQVRNSRTERRGGQRAVHFTATRKHREKEETWNEKYSPGDVPSDLSPHPSPHVLTAFDCICGWIHGQCPHNPVTFPPLNA